MAAIGRVMLREMIQPPARPTASTDSRVPRRLPGERAQLAQFASAPACPPGSACRAAQPDTPRGVSAGDAADTGPIDGADVSPDVGIAARPMRPVRCRRPPDHEIGPVARPSSGAPAATPGSSIAARNRSGGRRPGGRRGGGRAAGLRPRASPAHRRAVGPRTAGRRPRAPSNACRRPPGRTRPQPARSRAADRRHRAGRRPSSSCGGRPPSVAWR